MFIKKVLKKTGKVLLYILCIVLVIIIAVLIFINTRYGKNIITGKVQSYLQKKLHTKVVINAIDYRLPKWIEIQGVYIEDLHKDTLLYGEKLSVDLNMIRLISGETYIRKVEFKNIFANISRLENDSTFNFQFIIDAFAGNKPDAEVNKDTAALKLTLKRFILDKIRINFTDKYSGIDFTAKIDSLNTELNKFQPDRLRFGIDKFYSRGVDFSMLTYKDDTVSNHPKDTFENNNGLLLTTGQLDLKNVNVSVKNNINGMYYGNILHHLALTGLNLNLSNQKATLDRFILDSSFIKFIAAKEAPKNSKIDSSTSSTSWNIQLNQIAMKNNGLYFDNNNIPAKKGLDFSHLDIKNLDVNTGSIKYATDSIAADINQIAFIDKSGFKIDTTHANIVYNKKGVSATNLYIKTPKSLIQNTLELHYDDIKQLTAIPQNTHFNAKLQNTIIAINDLYLIMPAVEEFMPKQKFLNNLIALNTEVRGTLQQLNIPFLQLKAFDGTAINAKAILYNITDTKNLGYEISIFNTVLPKKDIQKFMPPGNYLSANFPSVINLNTQLKGNLKHSTAILSINSTNNSFRLTGAADIKNIDNSKILQYNVIIKDSRIEKSFLTSVIPPKSIPQSIELPELMILTGTAKGDMNNIRPNLKLTGTYGAVAVNGYLYNFKNKEAANYDLQLTTNNFKLGKLLKQDTAIGDITLSASAKGKGFNYKTMNADINADIKSAGFKQYDYQNIILNANLVNGLISSDGSVSDPNLKVNYTATADVRREYPSVEATLQLDTAQLYALQLYKDTLNASLKAYVKATDLNPKNLNVYAVIDSSKFNVKSKSYFLDSTILKANTSNGINSISFNSPLTDLTATGKFEYDKIGTSVLQYIDRYYNITDTITNNISPQQISFEGIIKENQLVSDIIPGLDYHNIDFKGSYASEEGDSALNLTANIPYFAYHQNIIHKGAIDIGTKNKEITGSVRFDTLYIGKNIFYGTKINANAVGDSLVVDAITQDNKKTDRFAIGASMVTRNKSYQISLKDNLILNYQKWNVANNNKIIYSPEGILVNDFLLSSDSARISAVSKENVLNSPIDITITNFDIKSITAIASNDTLLASGLINGQFSISEFDKKLPAFTGNIEISKLELQQQPVGTIKLFAQRQEENIINANVEVSENGNAVNVKGNYFLNNEEKQFEADANISRLSMATLQAFSKGNLTRSSGSINGKILLQGKFTDPRWNGTLNFDTARFTLAKLGSSYAIDKQTITLNHPYISFNNFAIKDSTNNPMVIQGQITSKSIMEYDLDININAKNFTLVNAPKAITNQVYGFAAINADISISGNSTAPDIQGNISLNDKTDVTLVLPERNINKDAAVSVVRFIDRDTFALPEAKAFATAAEPKSNFAKFLNYNLNIETSKAAAITIVIDPTTGDELKIQGDARLNAGVDPGGNIILAGNYELNSGYYILNYQFLRRQFNLLSGSTIAFSGSPTDAQININAEYIANTSASDLLSNEIGTVDAKTANTFKQEIPFRVLLYLKGSMKKPEISFDIQLPDENTQISSELRTTIDNKLTQLRADVAATNKQVFSLLLLNRFVGEQSTDFFKGNGSGGLDNVARESVSKFLSSAMDQIADDLFKGIDIDLNLNSYQDYSSGDQQQRTDLNVAVSKSFLNDRISVTVGKNFGIEGQDAAARAAQQKGAGLLPDVTVNYKLTPDGKYLLRAYKKSQLEVILDGYVIETGVSFVVTIDYDKFKELFNRKSKKEDK